MEKQYPPKKLVIINDLTGYGRCSLAVAIPIVSAMGVQACPVPTAIYSNHMAFPHWHRTDCTFLLKDYLENWSASGCSFDGVLCGFLGSIEQADTIANFLNSSHQDCVILDPVMGDHGVLYSSVSTDYIHALRKLLPLSDILTPNLTEACLLTDTPYPDTVPDKAFLSALCDKLHGYGPKKIVITGLFEQDSYHNFLSETHTPSELSTPSDSSNIVTRTVVTTPAGGPSRPGTGDIFASILAADALNQVSFYDSVKKAAEFVRVCTKDSAALDVPIREGVCLERHLSMLIGT